MKSRDEIIKSYYNIIDDLDVPSAKYLELKKQFNTLLAELNLQISPESQAKLEKLLDYTFAMSKEQEENAFFYGYKSAMDNFS